MEKKRNRIKTNYQIPSIAVSPNGIIWKKSYSRVRKENEEEAKRISAAIEADKRASAELNMSLLEKIEKGIVKATADVIFKKNPKLRTFVLPLWGKVVDTVKTSSEERIAELISKNYIEI